MELMSTFSAESTFIEVVVKLPRGVSTFRSTAKSTGAALTSGISRITTVACDEAAAAIVARPAAAKNVTFIM